MHPCFPGPDRNKMRFGAALRIACDRCWIDLMGVLYSLYILLARPRTGPRIQLPKVFPGYVLHKVSLLRRTKKFVCNSVSVWYGLCNCSGLSANRNAAQTRAGPTPAGCPAEAYAKTTNGSRSCHHDVLGVAHARSQFLLECGLGAIARPERIEQQRLWLASALRLFFDQDRLGARAVAGVDRSEHLVACRGVGTVEALQSGDAKCQKERCAHPDTQYGWLL